MKLLVQNMELQLFNSTKEIAIFGILSIYFYINQEI